MRDNGHDGARIDQYLNSMFASERQSAPLELAGFRGIDWVLSLGISIALLAEILFPLWCLSFP